jgi:hypothetical protein
MGVIDLLKSEYLRVSNRQGLDDERVLFSLQSAINIFENFTGYKIIKGQFTETCIVECPPKIYTPKRQPLREVVGIVEKSGYFITPIYLFSRVDLIGIDITRLLMGATGIYNITYLGGFVDDAVGDLSGIPYGIREAIYHLTEWIAEKWKRGLIAMDERSEFGGLRHTKDLDDYIKTILNRWVIVDV